MKIGVNLLNFGPGTTPERLERWAVLSEALGYHFLMISDHIAIAPDVAGPYPVPFYDPFLTLAWLSGITRRVELGTTVIILPYRHPLHTARLASNLDQVSGGRFIFGVGVGWAAQEFAALNVPFEQRGVMTDEYLEVIHATWQGERASFHGGFVDFDDVQTGPLPSRQPHPPVWVGGNREAAWRRAARYGDAWHPIAIRVPWLRDVGLPGLRAAADAAGSQVPALCPRIRLQLTDTPLDDETRLAGEGTLEQVRGDLHALQQLGASHVLLDTYRGDPAGTLDHESGWRMLATLAEQVLDLEREGLR